MAINAFLKIDGIEGASTAKGHKGEIDVLAFSWGISNSSTTTGGAGGAGKANVQDFAFSKELGMDSPDLFVSVCKGDHHDSAMLTVEGVSNDPKGQPTKSFYKVKFTDVLISSVSLGGSEGSMPQENVTLNFAKVEIEARDARGSHNVEVCDFAKGDF